MVSCVRFLLSGSLCGFVGQVYAADDQTSVTISLNDQIAEGTCGVYCGGGKGVMIRNPYDGYELGGDTHWLVVPSTFWHNDLAAANGVFPSSGGADPGSFDWGVTSYNVDCPHNGYNGFFDISYEACVTDPGTGHNSPWRYAATGYVIGDAMGNCWTDWDNIQDQDWGWGVFYPTDSNSVDFRCRWLGDYNGYDCPPDPGGNWPGGWIDGSSGQWSQDTTKLGPGVFPAGNPFADPTKGGGTGCHFDKRGKKQMDQNDAFASNGQGLTQDADCQCNYVFHDDWSHWVETWIAGSVTKVGEEDENWLGGGQKAPNRALDQVSCWVNNLRDMINIQNMLWYYRWDWNNQLTPEQTWVGGDPNTFWAYWGWNEIPMDLTSLTPHENHQTIFVHLPSSICGNGGGDDSVWCLPDGHQRALENDLDNWVNGPDQFGYLVPGEGNIANRPGSYIVFVREWYDIPADRWRKWFFCENWSGPLGKYKIVSWPTDNNGFNGACFLDYAPNYHRFYGNATNFGKLMHRMDEFVEFV